MPDIFSITGSNVGNNGVGVFKRKNANNLEFKKINSATGGKISVVDDTTNDEIDLDVVDATTTQKGVVELATSGENAANVVVQGNDSRLSDARAPTGTAGGDLTGTYPNPTITTNAVADAEIAAHTSTKVTITAKGQLNSAIMYEDEDNDIGTHYLEMGEITAPGNPAANKHRVYVDSVDDHLKRKDSAGAVKDYDAAAGGGEANTTSNEGTGEGTLAMTKSGVNLPFKTLKQGTNITITNNANDVTIAASGGGGGTEFDYIEQARNRVGFIEDFFNVTDKPNYTALLNGTGTSFANTDTVDTGVFGTAQLSTGTTATGEASIYFSGSNIAHQVIRLGQGITTIEGKIRLPALSTASQEYRFLFGITDTPNDPSQNEGVYLEYERTNSVNWRYSTANDGTKTENNSTTAVAAATWLRLKIVVNAAASSVEYFVNGTSLGTITTNIPAAAGDEIYPMIGIFKSAGTTASLADIDYVAFQCDLTTLR